MIQNILMEQAEALDFQIAEMKHELGTLPRGRILCVHNGAYRKWYKSNGTRPEYIPKSNRKLAEKLVLRKYLEAKLGILQKKRNIVQECLLELNMEEERINAFFDTSSDYHDLLEPYLKIKSEDLKNWQNEEYVHGQLYPENLLHDTFSGLMVRSKSEAMITNALYTHKIPFRYECGLLLEDTYYFPDFTICHPYKKKIIYWEHFGMMDDQEYASKAFNKLKIYQRNDIIPSINLITTYETRDHPASSYDIEKIVMENFCV